MGAKEIPTCYGERATQPLCKEFRRLQAIGIPPDSATKLATNIGRHIDKPGGPTIDEVVDFLRYCVSERLPESEISGHIRAVSHSIYTGSEKKKRVKLPSPPTQIQSIMEGQERQKPSSDEADDNNHTLEKDRSSGLSDSDPNRHLLSTGHTVEGRQRKNLSRGIPDSGVVFRPDPEEVKQNFYWLDIVEKEVRAAVRKPRTANRPFTLPDNIERAKEMPENVAREMSIKEVTRTIPPEYQQHFLSGIDSAVVDSSE